MAKRFPYRYRVLIFLFFFILITYLDRVCISLVGVRIKTEFHLSNAQFGWVVGAFALAYALFEIPTGIMGDRIGQRKVFIRIVLWWSLFTALTGATTGLVTLVVTRFLFGMGEAGAFPNGTGTIARWFPFNETGRGTSALIIGSNVGAAVAPLFIVPVAAAYGWRIPFFINAMIGIAWVLVCFLWFRNHPAEMKKIRADEVKLIEDNRRFNYDHEFFSWRVVFRNRSMLALVSSFFCSQWGLYFFVAWLPVYLQQGRHLSENAMKTTTSLSFIVGIAGGILAGFFVDVLVKKRGLKSGRKIIGTLSLAMMGFMFLMTAATTNDTAASACLMAGYFFMPVYLVNATATCVDIGRSKTCTVVGIMNFAGQMGAFFLAILFGKLADALHSFNGPLLVVSGVLMTGSVLWLAVDPTKQIVTEKQDDFHAMTVNENIILLK